MRAAIAWKVPSQTPVGGAADHRFEALAHLARRLVGEGDREKLGREGPAGRQDVREPGGQHPGLAGAGAGQHQHGPVERLDRLALRLVEAGHVNGVAGICRTLQSGFDHEHSI